ncbi:DNA mismatch repair protein MutL [Desulfitispora alkaliphila]|uniref:DNA mismatch repair endonuclease MutL n=1 Tax=Desulfitispora alkaliphila TaxID=622674 RepID=UPI003D1A64FA
MSNIHLLDYHTTNMIAAGEVVETPVSVVKELVENSIDAGSSRIEVYIERGGKAVTGVSDNGNGMSRDDLLLAFKKHSTSKIKEIDDLRTLSTLGFRGEALPSIASVARIQVRTKEKEALTGCTMTIEAGEESEVKEIGCSDGTNIVVKDLFFNTPARLKFMKSDSAYHAQISDLVSKIALSHPDKVFILRTDKKTIIQTPGNNRLLDVIASIWGTGITKHLTKIEFKSNDINVEGFISSPSYYRTNRKSQVLFVNNRLVKSEALTNAIEGCYKTLLPIRRFPIFVLGITLSPDKVDVNIHPAKTEVRFTNEDVVHQVLAEAVAGDLNKATTNDFNSVFQVKDTSFKDKPKIDKVKEVNKTEEKRETFEQLPSNIWKSQNIKKSADIPKKELIKAPETPVYKAEDHNDYVIIGQLDNSYILCESKGDLFLFDQHAAHERIIYNRMMEKAKNGSGGERQQLLIPVQLDLTNSESQVLINNIDTLLDFGFTIEHFGNNSFLLREVPQEINIGHEELVFREILDMLSKGGSIDGDTMYHQACVIMACKRAVKAGQKLSFAEMKNIINLIPKEENGVTCPHGRPTVISFSNEFIARKFLR